MNYLQNSRVTFMDEADIQEAMSPTPKEVEKSMSDTFSDGVQQVDQVLAKLCPRALRRHLLSR